MLDTKTVSNLNIIGKNILKDNIQYSVSNCYEPNPAEFSNLVLNSNLINENIIK